MKQIILGGPIGRIALYLREKFDFLHAAFLNSEAVGTLANDYLASHLVVAMCKPRKTFVDVGAHIGSIISEVLHFDSSIKVVAVEAIPEKAKKLKKKFPNVDIHDCAVGDSNGFVSFFIYINKTGFSSLGKPTAQSDDSIAEIKVPIKKLDDLIVSTDVDVIKIDVEGAELGVLRGAVNLLNQSRPIIMFESGPQLDDGLGYTKEKMFDFFSENNYAVLIPNRVAHNDSGLSLNGFLDSHLYPRRTTNYFAIPNERREEAKTRARKILNI